MTNTNGFANVTGGTGGKTVRVKNATDLLNYGKSSSPYIIEIEGTITLPLGMNTVQSNKTFLGIGTTAKLTGGGLHFFNRTNSIIKNITFTDMNDDCIAIQNSTHMLITNCDISNANDGLIDINYGSNYITVCWNKFHNHDLTTLVGHSDTQTEDRGKLKVTYHHNWFDGVDQRQPRVRFGEVHVYNNYYRGNNSLYALGVGAEAKIYSENNYFENIPVTYYLDNANQRGYVKDVGSYLLNSRGTWSPSGVTWTPSNYYAYSLDEAIDVKSIVMSSAGIIKDIPPTKPTKQKR